MGTARWAQHGSGLKCCEVAAAKGGIQTSVAATCTPLRECTGGRTLQEPGLRKHHGRSHAVATAWACAPNVEQARPPPTVHTRWLAGVATSIGSTRIGSPRITRPSTRTETATWGGNCGGVSVATDGKPSNAATTA